MPHIHRPVNTTPHHSIIVGGPSLEDLKPATPRQISYQSVISGYRSARHHRQLVCGLGASQSPQCCLLARSKERRRYCYRKIMLVHTSNLQWYTLYSLSRRWHRRYENWWREKYCSLSYYILSIGSQIPSYRQDRSRMVLVC